MRKTENNLYMNFLSIHEQTTISFKIENTSIGSSQATALLWKKELEQLIFLLVLEAVQALKTYRASQLSVNPRQCWNQNGGIQTQNLREI